MLTKNIFITLVAFIGAVAAVPTPEKRLDKISIIEEAVTPVQQAKRFDKISIVEEAVTPVQQFKRPDKIALLQEGGVTVANL